MQNLPIAGPRLFECVANHKAGLEMHIGFGLIPPIAVGCLIVIALAASLIDGYN